MTQHQFPTPSSAQNFFKRIDPRWCLNRRSTMCAIPHRDNHNILVMFRNVKSRLQIANTASHTSPSHALPRDIARHHRRPDVATMRG
jgi:hypothetical protein